MSPTNPKPGSQPAANFPSFSSAPQNIRNPIPTLPGGVRYLQVSEFASVRIREIKNLQNAVRNVVGNKRVYQSLPWHMRRRTMSYNSRRMPRRLKRAADGEFQRMDVPPKLKDKIGPQGKKRCRKYRRRVRFLIQRRLERAEKKRWLETHVWHAKRMKMKHMYGRMLPLHPVDRKQRSTHKIASNRAVIHDSSYLSCFEITGSHENLKALFDRPIFDPSVLVLLKSDHVMRGSKFLTDISIYHPNAFPYAHICIVDVLWCPSSADSEDRKLWLWSHPTASRELHQVLIREHGSHVRVNLLHNQLLRFSLIGPQSNRILHNVLLTDTTTVTSVDTCPEKQAEKRFPSTVWKLLENLRSTASLQKGFVLAFTTKDPRCSFPPKKVTLRHTQTSDNEADKLSKALYLLSTSLLVPEASQLWQQDSRTELAKRGTYKYFVTKRPKESMVPVIVAQRPGNLKRGYGSGWEIIVPAGWGMAFWNSLTYAGAKAVGVEEMKMIQRESCKPCFPEEFPDSLSGRRWMKQNAISLKLDYSRRPPSKRVNFTKNRIQHPFYADYNKLFEAVVGHEDEQEELDIEGVIMESLTSKKIKMSDLDTRNKHEPQPDLETNEALSGEESVDEVDLVPAFLLDFFVIRSKGINRVMEVITQHGMAKALEQDLSLKRALVQISILPLSKGKPQSNAVICVPNTDDIENWRNFGINFSGAVEKIGSSESSDMSRQLIGFVCEGGYSLIRGHGFGRGLIALSMINRLTLINGKKGTRLVMFRNVTSRHYRPATMKILE